MTAWSLPVVIALAICAQEAPAPPTEPVGPRKLVVLDVNVANPEHIDAAQAETLTAFIAARARRFPVVVVAGAELKQAREGAASCDQTMASCLGVIAQALGAELVLSTRAGRIEANFVASVQLYDARRPEAEERTTAQAWTLADLPEKLGPAVDELLVKGTGAQPSGDATAPSTAELDRAAKAPPPEGKPWSPMRLALVGGGVAGAAVGLTVAILGAGPALTYAARKEELGTLTRNFNGSDAALADAAAVHAEALDAKEQHNSFGRWIVAAGALLTLAGAGAVVAGFVVAEEQP